MNSPRMWDPATGREIHFRLREPFTAQPYQPVREPVDPGPSVLDIHDPKAGAPGVSPGSEVDIGDLGKPPVQGIEPGFEGPAGAVADPVSHVEKRPDVENPNAFPKPAPTSAVGENAVGGQVP